jgi:hypothetical protein
MIGKKWVAITHPSFSLRRRIVTRAAKGERPFYCESLGLIGIQRRNTGGWVEMNANCSKPWVKLGNYQAPEHPVSPKLSPCSLDQAALGHFLEG